MANPINQTIINTVITRLGNITTANGYEFNVGTVGISDRDTDGWTPSYRGILVEQQEDTENEEMSCPGNPPRLAREMILNLYGFVKCLDRDEAQAGIDSQDTTENQMAAAIQKAIANADAATWHTFGSNAIDAAFTSFEHVNEAGWDAVVVQLTVYYRVNETNPYSLT